MAQPFTAFKTATSTSPMVQGWVKLVKNDIDIVPEPVYNQYIDSNSASITHRKIEND